MSDPDDDFLDGMCDDDFEVPHPTTDEETPYVVLFCDDLDPDEHVKDRERLEHEAREWYELFEDGRAVLDGT